MLDYFDGRLTAYGHSDKGCRKGQQYGKHKRLRQPSLHKTHTSIDDFLHD